MRQNQEVKELKLVGCPSKLSGCGIYMTSRKSFPSISSASTYLIRQLLANAPSVTMANPDISRVKEDQLIRAANYSRRIVPSIDFATSIIEVFSKLFTPGSNGTPSFETNGSFQLTEPEPTPDTQAEGGELSRSKYYTTHFLSEPVSAKIYPIQPPPFEMSAEDMAQGGESAQLAFHLEITVEAKPDTSCESGKTFFRPMFIWPYILETVQDTVIRMTQGHTMAELRDGAVPPTLQVWAKHWSDWHTRGSLRVNEKLPSSLVLPKGLEAFTEYCYGRYKGGHEWTNIIVGRVLEAKGSSYETGAYVTFGVVALKPEKAETSQDEGLSGVQ